MFLLIRECNHCIIMKMRSGGIDFGEGESETQAQIRRPQRRAASAFIESDDENHALHHAAALRRVQQLPRIDGNRRGRAVCARETRKGAYEFLDPARTAGGVRAAGFAASGAEPIRFGAENLCAQPVRGNAVHQKGNEAEFSGFGDFDDLPAGRDGGADLRAG